MAPAASLVTPRPPVGQGSGSCAGCAALARRVAALEALLARGRVRPAVDNVKLLTAIVGSVKGCAFGAAELLAHGEADAALREALGALTSRQIGKRLRALEGQSIAGCTVRCVGRDGGGMIWIVQVDDLHAHPSNALSGRV
jgi:hypothetical protein